jgi:hypothetical protein
MSAAGHMPERPSWDCSTCGRPWPCDPAREELATELDQTALAMYLCTFLTEATGDMPHALPAELYGRFLASTRSLSVT